MTLGPIIGSGAGAGDVVGPASSTDNAIVRYDGTTGKLVQNSGVIIGDLATGSTTMVDVNVSGITTGFGLDLNNLDAITTGSGIRVRSNSSDTNGRNLVFVRNQNALATGTTCLAVQQDSNNQGVLITSSAGTTGNSLVIVNSGTGNSIRLSTTSQTTAAIISIPNADSLTSGNALNLVSNSASSTARNLIFMRNQNASATAAVVFRAQQDSTASAFVIDRSAVASTNGALVINDAGTSGGPSIDINKTGAGYTSGVGIVDIVRSGNLTGVSGESSIELSIKPSYTLTDPSSGLFFSIGASIDMSGISVTAGAGDSAMACLYLNANTDSDAFEKYSVVAVGLGRFDSGIIFGSTSQSTLSNYLESTFTPTVTLVGGAGNTTPVYTQNTGRYTRVGNRVFVDVYLTGDGGAEGAGTGQVNIALPITAGASNPEGLFPIGYAKNNATEYQLFGNINSSGTTVSLSYFNLISTSATFTGADQNNATRIVRLKFSYEV